MLLSNTHLYNWVGSAILQTLVLMTGVCSQWKIVLPINQTNNQSINQSIFIFHFISCRLPMWQHRDLGNCHTGHIQEYTQ